MNKQGGADALLHYGSKKTDNLEFLVKFNQHGNNNKKNHVEYISKLSHGMPDRLFFASEKIKVQKSGSQKPKEIIIEANNGESGLPSDSRAVSKMFFKLLSGITTYQFHDTSDTAKIKGHGYIDDVLHLRPDGGNLAAFLYELKNDLKNYKYYDRIVRHIHKVMPQFKDFDLNTLTENDASIRLNWRDTSGETLFGPHQISDGSLRFMALAALLLQPSTMIPYVIVIDEPELGLHPAAIAELAGMIKTASKNSQIIIATQSTRLVDEFNVENLVIVERDEIKHSSVFKKLSEEQLKDWLARYSVSELWEKNVLGGQP